MEWNEWNGKKVFIKTKTGKFYNGVVQDVDNGFIKLLDKFAMMIYLNFEEIYLIKEERG